LDLNYLSSSQQKHSKSQTHVPCYLQLKIIWKTTKGCPAPITKHNEQVKKKRVMLRQVIDVS
jgi:hypothetical protein